MFSCITIQLECLREIPIFIILSLPLIPQCLLSIGICSANFLNAMILPLLSKREIVFFRLHWPSGFNQNKNPFHKIGCQHINNVMLCQGKADCVPSDLDGCDGHPKNRSQCFDGLSLKLINAYKASIRLPVRNRQI